MERCDKYIIARWAYAIGEDFIGDHEYRRLENELISEGLLPEYTGTSWSNDRCPIDLLEKYNLTSMITKLKYTHTSESIPSINSYSDLSQICGGINEDSRASFKIDGFNIRISYYDGKIIDCETRGRSGNSLNANILTKKVPQEIPVKGRCRITVEFFIPNDKFESYCLLRGVKSQRNAMSTALANGDLDYVDYRAFDIIADELNITDKYEVLESFGFVTPKFVMVNSFKQLQRAIEILSLWYKSYKAPTDGIVLENSTMKYAIRLGAWQEKELKSFVKGYTSNRGIHQDSLLVEIHPVEFEGSNVSEIAVTNLQTIIDNNLRIDYPIAFVKRSGTTAVLDSDMTAKLQDRYKGRYDEYKDEILGGM